MRYRPMAAPASPALVPGRPDAAALARAPVVVFDRKDDLQHRYLRAPARPTGSSPRPRTTCPRPRSSWPPIRLGFGWGMLPDLQAEEELRRGPLVVVDPDGTVDVDLHWQQWRLRSPDLDRVAEAIRHAAATHLR